MKVFAGWFLLVLLSSSPTIRAADEVGAAQVYERMTSLVGVWEKEGSTNSDFNITFELTANDATLMEIWNYKGKKHSLTLYHLNGPDLMATHYCPQGNQPRLHLSDDATLNSFSFAYLDATNLESLDDSHQHSLGFDIGDDTSRLHRRESYLSEAGEESSEMILVRK